MTARLNFCSQALENMHIVADLKNGIGYKPVGRDPQFTLDIAKSARDLILLMSRAEKFILPDWGRIFNAEEWKLVQDVKYPSRLPYPVIACEYPAPYHGDFTRLVKNREAPSSKRIALAAEYEAIVALCPDFLGPVVETNPHPEKEGFYVFPVCFSDGPDIWTPSPAAMFFPRAGLTATNILSEIAVEGPTTELMQSKMGHIVTLPLGKEAYEYYPEHERPTRAARDCADEALAICHLMTALSLDKGRHTTLPAPERLNRKRAKKSKPPLFEYKVLDIVADVMGSPKEATHERTRGSHASPRMHNRRGHVRHLPSGQTTWVRNAIIGKPSRGRVIKDYAVHD